MREIDRQIDSLRARQAAAWVAALPHADRRQRKEFLVWLKESPHNVREFLMAYSVERDLRSVDPQRSLDVESLIAQIQPEVTALPLAAADGGEPLSQPTWKKWPFKIAAAMAAIAILGGVFLLQQQRWTEVETAIGEQRVLRLEDGSIVHLNAHSRMAVRFSDNAREVRLLEGEALFQVQHESQRAFRVFTRDAVIEDLGTRFNVSSRADGTKVAVIEGSVELAAQREGEAANTHNARTGAAAAPASKHILKAEQQAEIDRAGAVQVSAVDDLTELTSWQQRRLVYHREPLAHIVEDFNRYSARRIEVQSPDLMSRPYTGVFNADDPESLAQLLSRDPKVVVERKGDNSLVIRAR